MNSKRRFLKSLMEDNVIQDAVAGIGGSPRPDGNSDNLLKSILNGVSAMDVPARGFHLREIEFQGCIGCERCRNDKICTGLFDGMSSLYQAIHGSRGLVLVSPTHNYNVTAWMKAFIDRLYCFYDFTSDCPRNWSSRMAGQGRKAVLAAVCEQENKEDMGFTLEAMRRPLEALGYDIVDEIGVFKIFDRKGVKRDVDILDRSRNAGLELARALC